MCPEIIRGAKRPLIVSGGGTIYSVASEELRAFAWATGIPVSDTQAGKGAINFDHPCAVGGVGSTGARSANVLAEAADVVVGIGTRYSDRISAGQALGQKNTVLAIWMAYTYLDPLSSVGPGSYVLWQNLFNSYQLWKKRKKKSRARFR